MESTPAMNAIPTAAGGRRVKPLTVASSAWRRHHRPPVRQVAANLADFLQAPHRLPGFRHHLAVVDSNCHGSMLALATQTRRVRQAHRCLPHDAVLARELIASRAGRAGAFLGSLAVQSAGRHRAAFVRIEKMGYGTLWCGEAFHREAFSQAAIALASTARLAVATGIASIWARDATAMAAGANALAEAWPGRFLLGVGVSHPPLLERRGLKYGPPVESMARYLDAMRAARYDSPRPKEPAPVLIGALGPRMLDLAREQADGAFTFFVPVEHTRRARAILGRERFLAVEQAVVLNAGRERARRIAARHLQAYLQLDNYRRNLLRLGWEPADLAGEGSEPVFDTLIAWGDSEAVASRLAEHLVAGADQVVVNLITDGVAEPVEPALEEIAHRLLR